MSAALSRPISRPRGSAPLAALVIGVTLLIAATLRVDNITSSPGWFRDEGIYMETAWNAIAGEWRIGPVTHTWLSPWQTMPPLHAWTSGAVMHAVGAVRGDHRPNIQPFRWHSALCGLASVALLMALGHLMRIGAVGLLAALILAVDPWAVMFHRMGLPYPMLGLELLAAATLFAWHLREPRWWRLALALGVSSLAPLTVYYGVAVPLGLALALALHRRAKEAFASLLAFVPLALFLLWLWWLSPPGLAEDFQAMRAAARGTWNLGDWIRDFIDLLATTPAVPIGLVGLALLPRSPVTTHLQLSGLLFLVLWLRRPGNLVWIHDASLNISTPAINYQLAALLPLFALGVGQALMLVWRQLRGDATAGHAPGGRLRQWGGTAICLLALTIIVGSMMVVSLRAIYDVGAVGVAPETARRGFQSPLSHTLGFAKEDVIGSDVQRGVAPYLWARGVEEDDLVIAEYPLWWTLPGRHATLTQALAFNGQATDFFPALMDPERFVYACDWRDAQWAVIGPLTSRWRARGDDAVRVAVREIESQWSLAHRAGDLRVYAAPRPAAPPLTATPVSP